MTIKEFFEYCAARGLADVELCAYDPCECEDYSIESPKDDICIHGSGRQRYITIGNPRRGAVFFVQENEPILSKPTYHMASMGHSGL